MLVPEKNKNKTGIYYAKSLTGNQEEKKPEHKFVVTNKNPWKSTRMLTLSSSVSERKSQIEINPLKKQETRAKRIRSKEFYCLAFRDK